MSAAVSKSFSAGWTFARRLCAACGMSAMLAPLAWADTSERYLVVSQGNVAGAMVVSTDAQGSVSVDYSYRDNGRGPDLKESFTLGAFGAIVRYEGNGRSTFGAAIRESFEWKEGRAVWASLVDKGDQAADAGAVYMPVEGSPLVLAQIAGSLLKQPQQQATAVTGGLVRVERKAALRLSTPQGETPVALHAVIGLWTEPLYVWLRDDGSNTLFADLSPWQQVMPQGYEAQAPPLLARQKQVQDEYLAALQARLAQPLPGLTLIRNVRWFDAKAARMRGPAHVLVFDGRIAAIKPPNAPVPDADQTIDGSGKTLLPGLFDMHVHMDAAQGLWHLAGGVTTVRDCGNDNDELLGWRRQFDAGTLAGPHIVPLGFIEGESPYSARDGRVVPSLDEALKAVDWYADRGYHQLKLYNSIKPEWTRAITARAHALGMRAGGHVPAFMRAEEAVRAGYDEIHHINQVMLNFIVKPGDDTRTLARFSLVGDGAGRVDPDGAAAKRLVNLFKQRGTVVDPTVAIFEEQFQQRNGEATPVFGALIDHLPMSAQRLMKSNSSEVNDENIARHTRSVNAMLALIERMHRAGVTLVAGTDGWAGFGLHRELELYVKAGISAPQALRIATWQAARVAQVDRDAGSIEPGKRADLVLVDGDPSQRISDIRRPVLVIKGDVAYAPAAIHEALGIRPFTTPAAVVREARAAR
jgi:hypothetical protein